jgi:hypothetical protein
MRKWLEANYRGQIDDGSVLALDHWSKDSLRQLHDRFNIQPYLADLPA